VRIRILKSDEFCVGSVERKEETIVDELKRVGSNRQSDIKGIVALIVQIADDPLGPTQLPAEQSHFADKGEKIYQLVKGDLRVFYFYDSNGIIICTNAVLKQSQQVDPKKIDKAIQAKHDYFDAKSKGQVVWLDDEEE
jgi:hypothetical protein